VVCTWLCADLAVSGLGPALSLKMTLALFLEAVASFVKGATLAVSMFFGHRKDS